MIHNYLLIYYDMILFDPEHLLHLELEYTLLIINY